jgi:hypothetical protein
MLWRKTGDYLAISDGRSTRDLLIGIEVFAVAANLSYENWTPCRPPL